MSEMEPLKTLNFVAPFYGWGSTASRIQPLQGGSLHFTTNSLLAMSSKNLFLDLSGECLKWYPGAPSHKSCFASKAVMVAASPNFRGET